MNIENLPNELFISAFKYLSTADVFRAFHGLNSRLNTLLFAHFRAYGFDFQAISRTDFDTICQAYFPRMTGQITSIRFVCDENSPGQIDQYYTHGIVLNRFINLQSLSICYVRSEALALRLTCELQELPNFTRLSYKPFYLPSKPLSAGLFITNIWRLKQLKYCSLAFKFGCHMDFPKPWVLSTSIECLALEDIDLVPDEMADLLHRTPNLRYLSVRSCFQLPYTFHLIHVPQIAKLKLSYFWGSDVILHILKNYPTYVN